MNFWVNLTGHAATWRFQHSDQIDEWLASVPWRRDGDVRVLRIPCPELFVEIATALGRAARAVDIYGDIDVLILPGVNDERSIEMRLRSEFGLSDEATFRDFLRHFVSKLTRPTVIIAFVARASDGVLADDEARGLRDRVAASHPTVAATFVLMDVADAPLTGDGMRVTIGGPNCIVLRSQLVGEEQAWRAYTHVRLAWEVGGNLGVALEWNESAFDSLQRADDDGFERILNDRAEVAFAALDSTVANSVNDSIAKASSDRKVHLPENLFWSPAEDDWPRPVPGVARAILRRNNTHPARPLLRSCLVCAPLARAVLDRCLSLEARVRSNSAIITLSPEQNSAANRDWLRFRSDELEVVSKLYPAGAPAKPLNAIEFTSFDEFLRLSPTLPRELRRTAGYLKQLRNALAHGHYVSWSALQFLWQIEEQLWL